LNEIVKYLVIKYNLIALNSDDTSNFSICMKEIRKGGLEPKLFTIPQNLMKKISSGILKKIRIVRKLAEEQKVSLAIVGGFVRDLLLGNPSQDVDYVIFRGDINEFTQILASRTGSKIGKMNNKTLTTQIRFADGTFFEFNSTRKEVYQYPSRTPQVTTGTILDDLYRRDFTINTLLLFDEKVIDIFDGKGDLEKGLIQTTSDPETVFKEDYLRMLRAVRFASKLDFVLSKRVQTGIRKNVKNLLDVPKERTLNELESSLSYNPVKTLELMIDLNILETMFPQIINRNLDKKFYSVVTIFEKIRSKYKYLAKMKILDNSLYFAVFLMETYVEEKESKKRGSMLKIILDKQLRFYKFSNKQREKILFLIENRNSLLNLIGKNPSKLEIRQLIRKLDIHLENIICLTEAELSVKADELDFTSLKNSLNEIKKDYDFIDFQLQIDGNDIQTIFGLKGKKIKQLKIDLQRAIMSEEIINTRESCLKYIKEKLENECEKD